MSTNMDGPDALIEDVLNLPVEDLQTLLVTVIERLRPLAALVNQSLVVTPRYDLYLDSCDDTRKIPTIKEVRAITQLGLKESKDIVDACVAGQARLLLSGAGEADVEHAARLLAGVNAHAMVEPHHG